MTDAVTNTSPLLFLHALDRVVWLRDLFDHVSVPTAVVEELAAGAEIGLPTPPLSSFPWLRVVEPSHMPSEWLTADIGSGELATIALALEHPTCVALLDDARARRLATAAGIDIWGTLRVLLEAKRAGLTPEVASHLDRLQATGMWLTDAIRRRVLSLAGE